MMMNNFELISIVFLYCVQIIWGACIWNWGDGLEIHNTPSPNMEACNLNSSGIKGPNTNKMKKILSSRSTLGKGEFILWLCARSTKRIFQVIVDWEVSKIEKPVRVLVFAWEALWIAIIKCIRVLVNPVTPLKENQIIQWVVTNFLKYTSAECERTNEKNISLIKKVNNKNESISWFLDKSHIKCALCEQKDNQTNR